jgi:hypothetical protein
MYMDEQGLLDNVLVDQKSSLKAVSATSRVGLFHVFAKRASSLDQVWDLAMVPRATPPQLWFDAKHCASLRAWPRDVWIIYQVDDVVMHQLSTAPCAHNAYKGRTHRSCHAPLLLPPEGGGIAPVPQQCTQL